MSDRLNWYNDYRHAHLKFVSPDGDHVRAQMPNSHQPRYGDKYYAKLKALERQMIREYDELSVVMLTLTGSTKNANDGWRCPADHLRDVVNSWRPDQGRGVYHSLRNALGDKKWEYALVVEKHRSCYGHIHVAVFVDGEVTENDFHPVIDHHLRECEIAHRSAHDYYADDPTTRPISVRSIDPTVEANEEDACSDDDQYIGNLGSYIGAYIGSHGEPLFNRSVEELAFRAVCWATGTQVVRFSNGANEMIQTNLDEQDPAKTQDIAANKEPSNNTEVTQTEVRTPEVDSSQWGLVGICRVDQEGESVFTAGNSGVLYREIDGSEGLDPPKIMPPDRPRNKGKDGSLNRYLEN